MQSRREYISAFGWKFAERIGVQGSNFILTIILARLLTAEEYGLIALITVFTSIATTFVQGGFNTALIQRKKISGSDYISILWFSVFIAAVLYGILFFLAPYVAAFYDIPLLCNILRVMALMLFPQAFSSVQVAYLTRDLRFKILSISNFIAILAAAVVGISMAYCGCGAWALVAQQLVTQSVTCIAIFALTRWIPKGRFSFSSVRSLVPFGSRVLCQNLLVQIFLNIRSLIIGRVYSTSDLGYFNRGKSFPQTIMDSINGTIQTVLLPIYSYEQDDRSKVVEIMRQTIRITNFLIFPMVIGLACVAEPLVELLLTEKWLPCVPYVQIFAIGYIFNPVQISATQAYKAIGDSKTPLKIEVIRKITEVTLLLISIRFGVLAVALSTLGNNLVGTCVTFIPNARILKYSVRKQLQDILPALGMSIVMGAATLLVGSLFTNIWAKLLIEILVGVVVYMAGAKIFRMSAFSALIKIVKSYMKRGNRNGA